MASQRRSSQLQAHIDDGDAWVQEDTPAVARKVSTKMVPAAAQSSRTYPRAMRDPLGTSLTPHGRDGTSWSSASTSSWWSSCLKAISKALPRLLEALGQFGAAETGFNLDVLAIAAAAPTNLGKPLRPMMGYSARGDSSAPSSHIARPGASTKAVPDPWASYSRLKASPGPSRPRSGAQQDSSPAEDGAEDRASFAPSVQGGRSSDRELSWRGSKHIKEHAALGEGAEPFSSDKFWWKGDLERLCFELPMTPGNELAQGAPGLHHWWDAEVLVESKHFVAVYKPAYMRVSTDDRGLWEPSPTNFIHVAHQRVAMPLHADTAGQRGICHRLDKDTSGVQVFAKSIDSYEFFRKANDTHQVQKEYLALVGGRLSGEEADPAMGLIDLPLVKWQDGMRGEFGSVICADNGLPACTKYRALRQWYVPATGRLAFWGEGRWFTLVQLRILTGRTHQIRVHMAFIGHPLVGDGKYSPDLYEQDCAIAQRIFLHCARMEFKDMEEGSLLAASDLPADLQASLLQIHQLAEVACDVKRGGSGSTCRTGLRNMPGLTSILELSEKYAVATSSGLSITDEADSGAGAAMKTENSKKSLDCAIVHRCYHCGQQEKAQRRTALRGRHKAVLWTLESVDEADASHKKKTRNSETWGPHCLWIPTQLQIVAKREGVAVGRDTRPCNDDEATADELGETWGAHGSEWAWAHDGTQQNGWIRLLSGNLMESHWGIGCWVLLPLDGGPSLLIVTFNGVEHALRLCSCDAHNDKAASVRFEVVSKRIVKTEGSLLKDTEQHGSLREAEPVCKSQGWLDPYAEDNMPVAQPP